MKIRMAVLDLDGTLLKNDKTVSGYTVSVLRRCREIGVKIVCATARPVRAVKMLNLDFLFDAFIYHNGAVVSANGLISRRGIPPEITREIIFSAVRADNRAKICVEIGDRLYGNFDPSDIWPGIEITITDFSDLPAAPADKIILPMTTAAELNAAASKLPDSLYIEMSENTIGMIMDINATKAKAVKRLAEEFGISVFETAAFGDDYIDIGMLRECGVGVAVENAAESVKAAADFVCGSNEADGVAKWLEENIFILEPPF